MALQSRVSRALVGGAFCLCVCFSWFQQAMGQRRTPSESAGAQETSVTLGGWVQADYGQNVPAGVTVRLETAEGMVGGQPAVNTSGYFEIVGLARMHYRLTVTAPGFQVYQQDVDLRSVGDRFVVNVRLAPALGSKPLPLPLSPSFTDNKASKQARKEYEKGARALHDRNLAEAQAHLKRAAEEYPCYARAQTDLALVLSETQQLPASEGALKKALECDPDYLDAYNELGQLYYNQKKYQESETVLREGLRRSPASWQFYYQLGGDYYRLGQYGKAEQEYLKAESLSSSVPAEIHVKLADVYLKQGANDKAYTEMQAYLHAEPNGRFTAKLKSVMRQMESDRILRAPNPASAQSAPPEP